MTTSNKDSVSSRRRFLKVGRSGPPPQRSPAPADGQRPGPHHSLSEHLPSKDIFHEYALDYARRSTT